MTDTSGSEAQDKASSTGPLKMLGLIVVAVLGVLTVMALATLTWFASNSSSGVVRFAIATLMAFAIAWFGIGYFRQLGHPPPPDPDPIAVDPALKLIYVCEICGMELGVLMAAKEKAPKHCMEEMVLIQRI